MAKRPDSGDTLRVLVQMLSLVPRGRYASAQEIHDQLAAKGLVRDVRSTQRHLKLLSEVCDIEVRSDSTPFGYKWKPESRGLSVAGLDARESLLLELAMRRLAPLLPPSVQKALDGLRQQARGQLSDFEGASLERQWLGKVRVVSETQPLLPPEVREGILETVAEALYRNQTLRVVYRNSNGHEDHYEIDPLGLAQQGERLYLACRFKGYSNVRNLALHRILEAADTGLPFERPADFDLDRYEADGHFRFGEGKRVRLSFSISKGAGHHLLESRLSEDQVAREIEGGYRITATVVDCRQLDWWLNSFGDDVWSVRRSRLGASRDER